MKTSKIFSLIGVAILCAVCVGAQAAGVDMASFITPDLATGISLAGAAGITTFRQEGDVLTLTPSAAVASGVGFLFGSALFGVALNNVAISTPGEFLTEGVVTIGKTSALAIAVGDRVFWDPAGKVVNKTTTSQQCVGIAVEAAVNPSATVAIKLGAYTATAA